MNRFLIITIIIFCGCNYSHHETFTVSQQDSVINKMSNAIRPALDKMEYGSAIRNLDSVYPGLKKLNDLAVLSSWLLNKGAVYMYNNQFDSAGYYLRASETMALRMKLPNRQVVAAKSMLMNLFSRQNLFDSALRYGLEAHQMAEQIDTILVARISSILGELYVRIDDTANRRKYLFESYRYARDPGLKMLVANNIAKYYFEVGKDDSAIVFNNKVNAESAFKNNYSYQSGSIENIGVLLTMKGDLKRGLQYLKQSADLNEKYNMVDEELYLNIASNYSMQNDFSRSTLYADTALEISRAKNNYQAASDAFRQISGNKYREKRFAEAYNMLDSAYGYYRKSDSISFIKNAEELETRYATKSKDERISALVFQNSVDQKIRKQQKIIIFSMLFSILALGFAGVVLWRRRQLSARLREAELQQRILTNQMEPHFLFNMLATFQSYMRAGTEQTKLSFYFEKLSLMLRLILENVRKTFTTLHDEIGIVESYLKLQALQHDNSFEYSINSLPESESLNILVPSMLLQPIVENAVMHGVSNISYKGRVSVSVEKKDGVLYYGVEDNGAGMPRPGKPKDNRPHAMQIVRERLELISKKTGKPAKIEITDKSAVGRGQGTIVFIEVPFLRED